MTAVKDSNNIVDLILFTDKYFSFLETDFGFSKTEKWVSYEFHIDYTKDNIVVGITIEADETSIPCWVTLTDLNKPDDLDNTITPKNYYYLDSLEPNNKILKEIYTARSIRYNPMVDKFVKTYNGKNHEIAKKEMYADYLQIGRTEHETYVKEFAEILKRHSPILRGDLTMLPEREQPKEINFDIYERTDNGVKKVERKKFKVFDDLLKFIKGGQKN